jgi:hypothetical protein
VAMIREAAAQTPEREASYERGDAFDMARLWERPHEPVIGARPTGNLALPECLALPDRRGVVMTMSEYEERFRPPAPSLYQIFASIPGPNATRRRSRRFWVAAPAIPPEPPQHTLRPGVSAPAGSTAPAGNAATRLPAFAARLMTGAARWRVPARS